MKKIFHTIGFKSKDHVALTFSLYVAKWFCSFNGTFIVWSFGIHFGHFVKRSKKEVKP